MSTPDPIALLSRIAPVSDAEAAAVFGAAGRERLLDAVVSLSPRRTGRQRRRLARPLVVALAVLAVAAVTGAGWALTHGSAKETTSVDCLIDGETTVIDSTSGDPAADCAAIWPAPAPELQAYDDGTGGVAVIPADEKPPARWTPIHSQDVALIVLQENLDDSINGLASACFRAPDATAFAQRQLDRLGLTGWTVTTHSATTGLDCYGGLADASSKSVVLIPEGNQAGPASWPPHRLADALRPLTAECLSHEEMQHQVERRAAEVGMSQTVEDARNYQLTSVRDDTLRCAAVTESVAGTTSVVVRGPAGHAP